MRAQTHLAVFPLSPEALFEALAKPTAVCSWWGASQVIIEPRQGGLWAACWGDPDDPLYITSARISVYRPPNELSLHEYRYYARDQSSEGVPTRATCSFLVDPDPGGTRLTVIQGGFTDDPAGDVFYEACYKGWKDVLASLRDYLEENPPA